VDSTSLRLQIVEEVRTDRPAIGTLRLANDRSASRIIAARAFAPLIQPFLAEYPAVRVELSIEAADGTSSAARSTPGFVSVTESSTT
jgi:hypothetical protein